MKAKQRLVGNALSGGIRAAVIAGITGLMMLGGGGLAAQDSWEALPDVPFAFGVSSGGGLATDGQYLYAADFSGDGDEDYIDLDGNGTCDEGELLHELGIPNGSVRFARFDPSAGSWETLPTLNEEGVGGDSFSNGNFNGGLFAVAGNLYYYQFRAGPNRCALYRYDLADGLTGAWQQVWDLTPAAALIEVNAGMTAAQGPDGPVILHHRGGGSYNFCRSSGLDGGGSAHVRLTPFWAFNSTCFPRNGSWAFDELTGRLYHMSGDQLLHWEPSPAYAPEGFLTAVPDGVNDLAVFTRTIFSLRETFGWDPGGTANPPGVSLWGNSIVVVNDPSGNPGGPDDEDTGANVVYLVRGETSPSGWPFNEGRGEVDNGDFARHFPSTGNSQNLPSAPFNVGKGAAARYLDGCIYLLQGETRGSIPADPGDGIRLPGTGFARFGLRPDSVVGPLILPVGEYIAAGFVGLSASADDGSGTTPLFDGDWDSAYRAASANPAVVLVEFSSPTVTGAARARFGATSHAWSLEAGDSLDDLDGGTGTHVSLFEGSLVAGGETGWHEWNDSPVARRYYRFTVENLESGPVEIRELELQRPKPVQLVEIGGVEVAINHLEVLPPDPYLEVGDALALAAEASLSLGPDRYDVSLEAGWSSSDPGVASVDSTGLALALTPGTATLTAGFAGLDAGALLTVVEVGPRDDDVSVSWIQRLPVMDYVWDAVDPSVQGWPAAGSEVTWRAMVRNWHPMPAADVSYRWLVDGVEIASGRADLAAAGWTPVDLPRTWSFAREELTFEIDPLDEWDELSEDNNSVTVFTDSITVGFWVEQAVYEYFHQYQHELGIGSNGWEDWAQRQVGFWNDMFAAAVCPIDAPDGVLDRVRIDKITVVPDGALPLQGGSYPTNYPDTSDRSVDLMWGFPATLLNSGMYKNHTSLSMNDFFYYEGSLPHELGHARYLIDCYGFNVVDRADAPRVLVQVDGSPIAGTAYLPREWQWWDHVHIIRPGLGNPFQGLMASDYTYVDRYSAAALNRIAGHRAVKGNFNAPYNIGAFRNDLPDQNTVQLFDGRGQPLAGAAVSVYQAGPTSDWYGKEFDNVADLTFTADPLGRVQLGRNPFADGDLEHTYGVSNMVALIKVEHGGRTGFGFLEAGLFNMEFWRGHADHGYYAVTLPMISDTREIALVRVWRSDLLWRVQVIASGDVQPVSVTIDGAPTAFNHGSWWAFPGAAEGPRHLVATWTSGPTISQWIQMPTEVPMPPVTIRPAAGPQGMLDLQWLTRAGDVYDTEASTDLQDWSVLPGSQVFGDGAPLNITLPHSTNREFFRIKARPLAY
jgi:hypothetical protein